MPDDNFGPLVSFTDVEAALLQHLKDYTTYWLAARERRLGLPQGDIARPRSFITKQTFNALPGQETTPAIIVVSDGFAEATDRRGNGSHMAYLRLAVAAFVMGVEQPETRTLAGHYQAALLGLLMKHRSIFDPVTQVDAQMNEFRDLKIDDVDEDAAGRSMCAVRIELVYRVLNFVEEQNPPTIVIPTDDPFVPEPDDPEVETVIVETEVL